ncbi:MAG: GtrA family protein [Steroidobacteraceae bacterium]
MPGAPATSRLRAAQSLLVEIAGYAAASALALLVDALLLWVLVAGGVHYMLAASLSFTAGGFVAWWLSTRFVFRTHRVRNRRTEFLLFLALGGVGLTINALVIFTAVHSLHWSLPPAKASATGFTFMSNYLLRRLALFTASRATS